MPNKPARQMPDVLVSRTDPDGSQSISAIPWYELHEEGSFGAIIAEQMHLNNKYFIKESDRAVAVLAPAYLDELCTKLLYAKLTPGKSTESLLSGDRGALSAFSVKIDLAHSLGLINSITWSDLHIIRRIRNDFAHNVDTHSFSNDPVLNRCSQLSLNKSLKLKDSLQAREVFLATVMQASWEIAKPLSNGT